MWKIITALILLVGSFLGGFYTGRGNKQVEIVEHTGETKIQYIDRIVTVTKIIKPDGTVEETTKTEDKQQTTDVKTDDKSQKTTFLVSNYSVGAKYWTRYGALDRDYVKSTEIEIGRRIVGDIWAEIGIRKDQASVGIRVDF